MTINTWKAALSAVKGFSLSEDVAFDLLWREFNPRCTPPWSKEEIRHKIRNATKLNFGDGYLLLDSMCASGKNGKSHPRIEGTGGLKTRPEPKISKRAFFGLAGDIVSMLEPHTEADPVGMLVSIIAEFGAIITRKPHLIVDASYHPLLFYPVLVGNSSKSRKGSSAKRIESLFKKVDPNWTRGKFKGTISSGEGLCYAVRDEELKRDKHGINILIDEGVQDKRLFLVQSEFGAVLKTMSRDGNSLSGTIRDAWDGEDLAPMTKGNRIRSTSPHIVIVGHVTKDELLRNLNKTEVSNGFGNRFAWFYVKRSKELPFPGLPEVSEENRMIDSLREALAHSEDVDEIILTKAAKTLWETVYHDLSKDRPELSGSLLNRSEANVMRLSAIYTLLDCKSIIDVPHMRAALALWQYAIDSVFFIFGDKTGDSIADAILEGIKRAGEDGMSDADIYKMFGSKKTSSQLGVAKKALKDAGLIIDEIEETKGRSRTIWKLPKAVLEISINDALNTKDKEGLSADDVKGEKEDVSEKKVDLFESSPSIKKKRHRRTKAQIAADNAKAKTEDAIPEDDHSDDPVPPVEAKTDPGEGVLEDPAVEAKVEEIPSEDKFLSETGEDDDTLGDLSEESAGTDDIFDAGDDDNSLEGLPDDFEGESQTEKVSETAGAGGDDSLDDLLEI